MTRERVYGRLEPGKRFLWKPRELMCAPEQIGSGANPASCSVVFEVGFCGGVKLTSHIPLTPELRILGALPSISLGVLLNTKANLLLPFIVITNFETMGEMEWSSLCCNVRSRHSLIANVETAIISFVLLCPSVDKFFFSEIHYLVHCHLHKNLIKNKILTRQFI
jgi:hypothetical protein